MGSPDGEAKRKHEEGRGDVFAGRIELACFSLLCLQRLLVKAEDKGGWKVRWMKRAKEQRIEMQKGHEGKEDEERKKGGGRNNNVRRVGRRGVSGSSRER